MIKKWTLSKFVQKMALFKFVQKMTAFAYIFGLKNKLGRSHPKTMNISKEIYFSQL